MGTRLNKYIKTDPWKIIEEQFDSERTLASESLFSIGNGRMGQRANFEEQFSGKTLQGSYIGGVYYPDKTRVGWWKNGYPEYFAKVLNSAFWIGVDVKVGDTQIDLAKQKIESFYRELDMQNGLLTRRFEVVVEGVKVAVEAERFVSLPRYQLGALSYSVKVVEGEAAVELTSYIDADVRNEDANYDEKFWDFVEQDSNSVTMRTRKTGFSVCWHQQNRLSNGQAMTECNTEERIAARATVELKAGEQVTLHKFVGVTSSFNHPVDQLDKIAAKVAKEAAELGFEALKKEQAEAWHTKWEQSDIEIEGDDEAQQGIRFCIFQLLQTYTGDDARLNIGPKGFTGEKYGGSTYWDTEAYCLPFYMATAGEEVARQLLIYRHNHLDKAIENAKKLGFTNGAALYPMVTMNGEECHNEWEITFEEVHRNGAIAYAIHNYIRYTGDKEYLASYGAEVLLSIARFWSQRITFAKERGKYVMLGVTGPNEYDNNINNNWYTNYIACWCMEYAEEAALWVKENHPEDYKRICEKRSFDLAEESKRWRDIRENMHLPKHKELGIFLQQDDYMDKEQILVSELDPAIRPLNQHWSWDRILRSCFIKQADVLQGLYFFEEHFDTETIRRNFEFYEPRTVHESSLSPCVHSILATRIGDMERAFELYHRTARLDLDDYNHENDEGLHITSMAGSWMSVVEGFGGMRVENGKLSFTPSLPKGWSTLKFKVNYRGSLLEVEISDSETSITTVEGKVPTVLLNGVEIEADGKARAD